MPTFPKDRVMDVCHHLRRVGYKLLLVMIRKKLNKGDKFEYLFLKKKGGYNIEIMR